jgi:hypothetical protein
MSAAEVTRFLTSLAVDGVISPGLWTLALLSGLIIVFMIISTRMWRWRSETRR